MIDFTQKYDRGAWLSFLEDSFLPDDFGSDARDVPFSEKLEYAQSVTKLGESAALGLTVFEIKHKSTNDARVGLSKEAFRLVCNYTLHSRALVLFVPQNTDNFYRFSLVEFTPIVRDDGKVTRDYSNPRRYSFILGRDAKVKTPQQYLVEKGRVKDTGDLKNRFSVEVLTKEFYSGLFKWYDDWAIKEVAFPEGIGASAKLVKGGQNRIHLIRLITRLIFVWFIKQKGLIPEWIFDKGEVSKVLKTFESDSLSEGAYYNGIIQNLFFATLNKPINERCFANEKAGDRKEDYGIKTVYRDMVDGGLFKVSRDEFISRLDAVPFLNGGLFECLDNFDDKSYIDGFSREKSRCAFVPNALFWGDGERLGIIELFNLYNFTIEENTPQDVDVALDPELLGKAFENLLGTFNPETLESARNATGSFYTPREIVSYMVDSSLKEYFKNYLKDDADADAKLEALFSYQDEGHSFAKEQVETLIAAINDSKILDPACGSGAFPMGILQRLVHILGKLDPGNKLWEDIQRKKAVEETEAAYKIGDTAKRNERLIEISAIFQQNSDDYGRKLFLIENCIYGIDIQPIAIQISKLRFFISLIVNQEKGKNKADNYAIRPLPNLETKFVAANTLIGIKRESGVLVDPEIARVQKQLLLIRHQHFSARNAAEKIALRKEDRRLAQKLAEILKNDGFYNSHDAEQMARWNPYDQNTPSDFFDPEWMFGAAEGFDVVVGNPPYVSAPTMVATNQKLRDAIIDSKTYSTLYQKWDLYIPFMELGIQLLSADGVFTMIVPYPLTNQTYGKKLRELVVNHCNLIELVDLNGTKVFENATVSNCIPFISKSQPDGSCFISHINEKKQITRVFKQSYSDLVQDEHAAVWNLTTEQRNSNRHSGMSILGDFCYISVGMVLNADENTAKGEFLKDDLISETRDDVHCRKYIEAKDIERYRVKKFHYLEYNTERCPDKLRRPTFRELYNSKKLVMNCLGTINAAIDEQQFFLHNHSLYCAILWKDLKGVDNKSISASVTRYSRHSRKEMEAFSEQMDLRYLLGVLNSKYAHVLLSNLRGGDYHIYPEHLRNLPIPDVSEKEQQPIVELVEQILAAKGRGEETAELEARIDRMVYGVYGLGEREVRVVEPEFPLSRAEYEKD